MLLLSCRVWQRSLAAASSSIKSSKSQQSPAMCQELCIASTRSENFARINRRSVVHVLKSKNKVMNGGLQTEMCDARSRGKPVIGKKEVISCQRYQRATDGCIILASLERVQRSSHSYTMLHRPWVLVMPNHRTTHSWYLDHHYCPQ